MIRGKQPVSIQDLSHHKAPVPNGIALMSYILLCFCVECERDLLRPISGQIVDKKKLVDFESFCMSCSMSWM
jgi:hypothetical protein